MPLNSAINTASLSRLLNACKTHTHLHQLHAHVIRRGLEQHHFLVSRLLSLSLSLKSFPYASSIFHRLISPSAFLFNLLLNPPHFPSSLSLFLRVRRCVAISPDAFTFCSLIKACAGARRFREGAVVHASVVRYGVGGDVYVGSGLVDLYGKCGKVGCARKVFDEMGVRNVVTWTALVVGYVGVGDLEGARRAFEGMPGRNLPSWNAMVGGLVRAGELKDARGLFDEMPERDVVSFTVMIDGYAKAGDMAAARALFEDAPEKDIVAWSALIYGYSQNGQPHEAVKMFRKMELMGVEPDEFVMVSLMSACAQLGSLDLAKWVDSYVSRSSIDIGQAHVIGALIDMNVKCGNMDRAGKLFEKIPTPNVIIYCSMIKGLSDHGHTEQAVGLFNRMIQEGLIPDEVAFTVILTACSRGGLAEEGWHYFEIMTNKYSIAPSPDHYACMVDLLSRAGWLNTAYELLNSMPMEPNSCAWGALLGACKLYGNVELGEVVAKRLFELEPQSAGSYMLLSDIYASANQWLDVSLVRNTMKERGIKKIPGRCCV